MLIVEADLTISILRKARPIDKTNNYSVSKTPP